MSSQFYHKDKQNLNLRMGKYSKPTFLNATIHDGPLANSSYLNPL